MSNRLREGRIPGYGELECCCSGIWETQPNAGDKFIRVARVRRRAEYFGRRTPNWHTVPQGLRQQHSTVEWAVYVCSWEPGRIETRRVKSTRSLSAAVDWLKGAA